MSSFKLQVLTDKSPRLTLMCGPFALNGLGQMGRQKLKLIRDPQRRRATVCWFENAILLLQATVTVPCFIHMRIEAKNNQITVTLKKKKRKKKAGHGWCRETAGMWAHHQKQKSLTQD